MRSFSNSCSREEVCRRQVFFWRGPRPSSPLFDQAIVQNYSGSGRRRHCHWYATPALLNVLANIMGKHPRMIFGEFKDSDAELYIGRGDVKYHKGYHQVRTTDGSSSTSPSTPAISSLSDRWRRGPEGAADEKRRPFHPQRLADSHPRRCSHGRRRCYPGDSEPRRGVSGAGPSMWWSTTRSASCRPRAARPPTPVMSRKCSSITDLSRQWRGLSDAVDQCLLTWPLGSPAKFFAM